MQWEQIFENLSKEDLHPSLLRHRLARLKEYERFSGGRNPDFARVCEYIYYKIREEKRTRWGISRIILDLSNISGFSEKIGYMTEFLIRAEGVSKEDYLKFLNEITNPSAKVYSALRYVGVPIKDHYLAAKVSDYDRENRVFYGEYRIPRWIADFFDYHLLDLKKRGIDNPNDPLFPALDYNRYPEDGLLSANTLKRQMRISEVRSRVNVEEYLRRKIAMPHFPEGGIVRYCRRPKGAR